MCVLCFVLLNCRHLRLQLLFASCFTCLFFRARLDHAHALHCTVLHTFGGSSSLSPEVFGCCRCRCCVLGVLPTTSLHFPLAPVMFANSMIFIGRQQRSTTEPGRRWIPKISSIRDRARFPRCVGALLLLLTGFCFAQFRLLNKPVLVKYYTLVYFICCYFVG